MPAPPERVWPLVSDTASFNRTIGTGPWGFSESPDPTGGSVRVGSMRSLLVRMTWDERPFHWIEGREFSVLRVFHSGPFLEVYSQLRLEPAEGGQRGHIHHRRRPRSPLWSIPARLYLGSRTHRQFDRAFRDIASYLEGEVEAPYPQTQAQRQLSGRTGARLRGVVEALEKTGFDRNMGDQLVQYVGSATDGACYRTSPMLSPTRGERTGRRCYGCACTRRGWACWS